MVNLIPPTAKRNVIIEYWLRVLTVWSVLGSITAILFAVTLVPVYVLVEAKISAYEESATLASQKIASFETVSKELARSSQQAQLIITSGERSLSELIYSLSALEGMGVSLDEILVQRLSGGIAPIKLSGMARDRQALSDFRDKLLAEQTVATVDFPISNLAKDRDIQFSMTVTLANQPTP